MFIKSVEERMRGGPLTHEEICAVMRLFSGNGSGFKIVKNSSKAAVPLGVETEAPTNPVTGRVYTGETGEKLSAMMGPGAFIGQFAGKGQWSKVGRRVLEGEEPVATFISVYSKADQPKVCGIYAYEQTEGA